MTLLQEIQSGATTSEESLTTVLRKCMILAARLDNEPFRDWVKRELKGYPENRPELLPVYREKVQLQVHGDFSGFAGSGLRNARIPPAAIDPEYHDLLFFVHFYAGVGYFESQLEACGDFAHIPWPADALVHFGEQIYEGQQLMAAHKVLPATLIRRVLDQIRDRVLAFSLEIEKEAPDAGEARPGDPPLPEAFVSQTFHTTIIGDGATLNAAGRDLSATKIEQILPGGWEPLRAGLTEAGVPADELESLKRALEADGAPVADEVGPRTRSWLGRATEKAASGAWPVGTEAGAGVIAGLVLSALGLG
ncbi:MAG TPA: hypothetical protein VFP23_09310 [Solirubrobacterales bacterium]|nr:hypothetical protein [Solirubrobacterales bacterium]